MAVIETSVGRIGVTVAGQGLTPIMFLHGVGSDKSVWQPQLDHFGAERAAIAIDYPGYGESAFLSDATRDDFARAALATLDTLNIASAHICGLSLGGVVAIAMHHLASQRCRSLILADTFAVHPQGQAIYERSLAGSNDLPAMARARADALLAQPAQPAVRQEVIDTMSKIDPAGYRLGAAAVWLANQRERAAAIDVPTLVVVGDQDSITPPALSSELADVIPSARMEVISSAGHLTNLERPAEFNSVLAAFLEAIEA